jgi:hypothetical protein
MPAASTTKPTENMTETDKNPTAKDDSATAKSEPKRGLFVVVTPAGVQLHTEETAEAAVSTLTYGSKQHRKEAEANGDELPEGGGSHEINRDDIHVYRLSATEVHDF